MPPVIYVNAKLLERAISLEPEIRKAVEDAKERQQVDVYLSEKVVEYFAHYPGLAALSEREIQEKKSEVKAIVETSLDNAFALIAMVETPEQLESIVRDSRFVGRRKNVTVKLDTQQIATTLRLAFEEIDRHQGLHAQGVDNKRMIRRKVIAALAIINDSLNHRSTYII